MSVVQLSALIISAFLFSSSSALDQHESDLRQHYAHVARIADFSCLQPQPRLISVSELFSQSRAYGKAYFPDVTVLHRCEECTGSCGSGHTCSVNKLELVLLPFKATFLNGIGKFRKGSWQIEYHELLNHTECACTVPTPHDSCHIHSSDNNIELPTTTTDILVDMFQRRSS